MAIQTEPAWVLELKKKLAQPYTEDEKARIRRSLEAADRINAGKTWPPGTFQRLLDMARAEDEDESCDE